MGYFKTNSKLSEKEATLLNELRDIAFDKQAPRHLRESAVSDIVKVKEKVLPKFEKLNFLEALLKNNQKNEAFVSYLIKSKKQIFSKIPEGKSLQSKKLPIKKLKTPDEEFVAKTLVYLKRNLSKDNPWGTKLPESEFLKIQKLVKLAKYGFYVHRNLISGHLLIPFLEDQNTKNRRINLTNVTSWKIQNKPILQSYCTKTEEIIEARLRYKLICKRLDIKEKYLLKDLIFNITTTRGNLILRYDFVGSNETKFGLEGSWIISILGVRPETIKCMLDFNWVTLRAYLKKSKVSCQAISPKMLDSTILIKASSDEIAHKEVGFFLEELLIFILRAKITDFKINAVKYTLDQQRERSAQINSLQKRTQWIIKNPRGPIINSCLICGRGLSVSISVDREIGPDCWEKLSREKEIRKIDLQPGYNPLRYEATINEQEFLENLIATYSIRG